MTTVAMPLRKALLILAAFHTRDDDEIGFVVELHPRHPSLNLTPYSQADYIEAWRSVRAHVHMQTEPKEDR